MTCFEPHPIGNVEHLENTRSEHVAGPHVDASYASFTLSKRKKERGEHFGCYTALLVGPLDMHRRFVVYKCIQMYIYLCHFPSHISPVARR